MASVVSGCPSVMTASRPNENAVWMRSVWACPGSSQRHQCGLCEASQPSHCRDPEFLFLSWVFHPSDFYVRWVSQVQLLSEFLLVFHARVWHGPVLRGLE